MSEDRINWSQGDMLEVTIKQPDDFLKVRETLTRIGVASRKDKTLFQSCHILHKQGKYYITHFFESLLSLLYQQLLYYINSYVSFFLDKSFNFFIKLSNQ